MKHNWKRAVVGLLVLVLLVPLCFGCGGGKEKGVTIIVGEINDLTGFASPALLPIHYALEDMVRYYNDEGLIPGVKIKIAAYDTRLDAAREVLGYEWVKERGAKLIVPALYTTGEAVRPFADREKVILASTSTTEGLIEPPGWVFCFGYPGQWGMKALMKWISENQWDYTKGIPKIGFGAYSDPFATEEVKMMKQYCQDNPDKFQWGGSFLAPIGTMFFSGGVEKLKDCDYVASVGFSVGYLMKEFRDKGYKQTFVDSGGVASIYGWLLNTCGPEALDGTLTANQHPIWGESYQIVNFATELLHRYRSGQAEDIIQANNTYLGSCHQFVAIFQILQTAIEEVGAENFDNQAFYDAAIKYQASGPLFEGYPQWGFSEAKRNFMDQCLLYRFDAKAEKLVRVSDWLPATR